jgi:hypothetical protein
MDLVQYGFDRLIPLIDGIHILKDLLTYFVISKRRSRNRYAGLYYPDNTSEYHPGPSMELAR